MKVRWLGGVMVGVCACSGVLAMNGRAVTVLVHAESQWYRDGASDRSRLVVSTISGSSVTRQDTILKDGRFYYPAWNFDGTKIAFYRDGAGVSIVDADGSNLRDVVQIPNWGNSDQEQFICWPAADGGKWIYYHLPGSNCFRGGTGEIWKVNVDDPTRNSMVFDYKRENNIHPGDPAGPGLWKFSLSADALYACAHTNGTTTTLGYSPGIIPHTFPPQGTNPRATAPQCQSGGCYNACNMNGECNSALSASGSVTYHFSGGHNILYSEIWDHTAGTIASQNMGTGVCGSLDMDKDVFSWATSSPGSGDCFVWPRGTCNSDQIITILIGWQYGAEYAYCGNNQVVVNWKDKEAVFVTNNPEPPHPNGYVPDGTYYWYAEPGDFHLDGGPDGCYEDVDGNWVSIGSGQQVRAGHVPAHSRGGIIASASGTVAVYDLRGARVGVFSPGSLQRTAQVQLRRGVCVVTAGGANSGCLRVVP